MAAVADLQAQFDALGVHILAISTDSVHAHRVFTQVSPSARKVRYPLLSDRSGRVSWLYGALDPQRGVARRVSVLVTPEGQVAFYLNYPLEVGRSAAELLRLVQAVQFSRMTGLGVPADWQPGEPGIQRDIARAGTV